MLVGWELASAVPRLSRKEKSWIVAAAVAPDLDGLGIAVELATRNTAHPLYWWSEGHHLLAHNLSFALLLSLAAWLATRRIALAGLVFASVHGHLLCDLAGSRGPDGYSWPIPYLWPFSDEPQLTVSWQWKLDAWPNVALGVALLAHTLWRAHRAGTSPLELVSPRANDQLVTTLRHRFPRRQRRATGGPGNREGR
jgi:membrane-bound metal-dependent hydrolase YbcI (DUF457 family)